jgi:hypothetical protein
MVKTKVWRGQWKGEAGLDQLESYLETEGEADGFYVVFHARPNVYGKLPDDQVVIYQLSLQCRLPCRRELVYPGGAVSDDDGVHRLPSIGKVGT